MQSLISVIIPTYNCVRYVNEAVASALAQTYEPIEVIVIDDGSSDDTESVLAPYVGSIRYHRQENRGAAEARNAGIEMAAGEYIAFLDSDDLWVADKIRTQVDALESNPDFPFVHSDASVIDATGQVIKASANRERQTHNGRVFEEFFMCSMAASLTSTVLMRRECFATTGTFDARYPILQDYALFLRVAWHYPVYYIDRPLTKYRMSPSSLTRTSVLANIREQETILREFVEEHDDHFASHEELLQNKWARFHYESGLSLLHHGLYRESHSHFAQCRATNRKAAIYSLLTSLPAPMLSLAQRARRKLRNTRS